MGKIFRDAFLVIIFVLAPYFGEALMSYSKCNTNILKGIYGGSKVLEQKELEGNEEIKPYKDKTLREVSENVQYKPGPAICEAPIWIFVNRAGYILYWTWAILTTITLVYCFEKITSDKKSRKERDAEIDEIFLEFESKLKRPCFEPKKDEVGKTEELIDTDTINTIDSEVWWLEEFK